MNPDIHSSNLARRWQNFLLVIIALLSASSSLAETSNDDHHTANGYTNPWVIAPHGGLFGFIRARLSNSWQSYDANRDIVPITEPAPVPSGEASSNATVTWIGHATVLIQHQGINVLTDPMFSDYASPVSFAGPKRISQPAIELKHLPPIHAVVISHNHYDHLDTNSIKSLGDAPMYYVPLGLRKWFINKGIAEDRVVEMDWWSTQQLQIGDQSIKVTSTPSQHFSGRGLTDRNATLWSSWAIEWQDFRAWFGGDTGYNDSQFKDIGDRFGSFDLSIIPIGAYEPRSFMGTIHVNPAEAVQIHSDLNSRSSMGIHWGTFVLAGEGVLTPLEDLALALDKASLPVNDFAVYAIGETRHYPANDAQTNSTTAIPHSGALTRTVSALPQQP